MGGSRLPGEKSRWITSEEARVVAHRLRHINDAVMVGAGTVVADDPELTSRVDGGRSPLRVVLDSTLRSPEMARVLEIEAAPTLVITTDRALPERAGRLRERGVDVEVVPASAGGVDLGAALALLGALGKISVLIEGGASLLGSAFDARVVDKVVAMLAPRIIGGAAAPGAVGGTGVPSLGVANLLADVSVDRAGPDLVVTGYCVR